MSRRHALLWATAILASCAKETSVGPEPFPNQPGALTAQELQAASAAARTTFPLVSSGKRAAAHPMSAYAVFAGEPAQPAANVVARKRIVCNYWAQQNAWRCGGTQSHYEVDAGGRKHRFSVFAMGVPEASPQLLAELAEYSVSACFGEQLQKLAAGRPVPKIAHLEDVGQEGSMFLLRTDMTTQPNVYYAQRLEPAQAGCRFGLKSVRIGATGAILAAP